MIQGEELIQLIQATMVDADVTFWDRTGMSDHYVIEVVSEAFIGKNLIEQRQLIYSALDAPLKDGRLHAIEIKTQVPASAN